MSAHLQLPWRAMQVLAKRSLCAGALHRLVDAHRRHADDAVVVDYTLRTARFFASRCKAYAAMIDAGVPAAAVACMRRFAGNATVLGEALSMLGDIAVEHAGGLPPAEAADAVSAALTAWKLNDDKSDFAAVTSSGLATLVSSKSVADAVVAGGGLDVAVAALCRFRDDAEKVTGPLIAMLAALLTGMTDRDDLVQQCLASGLVPVLLQRMLELDVGTAVVCACTLSSFISEVAAIKAGCAAL